MTVLTKPLSGLQLKKPLQTDEKLIEETAVPLPDDSDETDSVNFLYQRVTRVGRLTNCCLLVSLLALLILGVGAGVHSYKIYLLRNTYAGVCHLPLKNFFHENTAFGESIRKRLLSDEPEPYHFLLDNMHTIDGERARPQSQAFDNMKATFDFDIDVEEENYEVMEMPELFLGRYMHDFKENKTVIINRDRCYIMELDRTRIAPPKTIFDIINKVRIGYYSLDLKEIKKNYRIVGDALNSLEGYGELASRACSRKTSYRLEELVGSVIVKRDATAVLEKFGEFTGDAILQYHIVNDK